MFLFDSERTFGTIEGRRKGSQSPCELKIGVYNGKVVLRTVDAGGISPIVILLGEKGALETIRLIAEALKELKKEN